jgi:hypothetical protein
MARSYQFILGAFLALTPQVCMAQSRDISEPLRVLGGTIDNLFVTRLNKTDPGDLRLALELQLSTQLEFEQSMEAAKTLPAEAQAAILKLCLDAVSPLAATANATAGFMHIDGIRVMLKSKPTAGAGSASAGNYLTLIFPESRGCKFGW